MKRIIMISGAILAIAGAGVALHLLRQPSEEDRKELYWALRDGDLVTIRELVEDNSRLADARYDDTTPLASAAGIYSPIPNRNAIVRFLLERGADPNVDYGRPLRGCIYSNDSECIQLLLDHGADPLLKNPDGETPLDRARYHDVRGIPEMLEAHIAKTK